jgi:hypothetical protein
MPRGKVKKKEVVGKQKDKCRKMQNKQDELQNLQNLPGRNLHKGAKNPTWIVLT